MIYMRPVAYDRLAMLVDQSGGVSPAGLDSIAVLLAPYGITPAHRELLVFARNEFCARPLDQPITFREFCRGAFIERKRP